MKEFLVGLLVLVMISLISVAGVLLFPLLLVLGFFLRFIVGILLLLLTIWLVGKLTLLFIEQIKKTG